MKTSGLTIVSLLLTGLATPAGAEVAHTDSWLSGRRICWYAGLDSEQYNRDHTYVYTYHTRFWNIVQQFVIHGAWTVASDGSIKLTLENGDVLVRKYDFNSERVFELTGSLDGGRDGYFC